MRRAVLTLIGVVAMAAVTAVAQQGAQGPATAPPLPGERPIFGDDQRGRPPSFQTAVEFVRLDVRVKDPAGRFVRDLTRDDLAVFEDGKEQTISTFSLVEIPVVAPDLSPPPLAFASDVSSNASLRNGRLYVLMLDDLHIDHLREMTVRQLAQEFVEHHMTDQDRVAIATTGGWYKVSREFTNDRAQLLRAIAQFGQRELPGPGDSLSRDLPNISGAPQMAGAWNERIALESMKSVMQWLGTVPERRKALVFISEGLPLDFAASSDIVDLTREVVGAAAEANVSIYGIDAHGLPTAPASTVKPVMNPDDDPFSRATIDARQSLAVLSEETGGVALLHSNDFSQAFDRIVEDSSAYYLIGYTPAGNKHRAKFHKIEVKARRRDLSVQTRAGYSAQTQMPKRATPPKGIAPALGEAFQSPVPIAGLTLDTTVAAFRGNGATASVAVVVEASGANAPLAPDQQAVTGRLSLFIAAAQENGKVKDSENGTVQMHLRPVEQAEGRDRGVRLVTSLDLPPGHYHLRVAALHADNQTRGSVLHDFDVANFRKDRLSISGLLLSTAAAGTVPTTGPFVKWKQTLGVPPTTNRSFLPREDLLVFGEIYAGKSAPGRIAVTTSVTTVEGRETFRREEAHTFAAVKGGFEPLAHSVSIPLREFAPGRYILKVEAREPDKAEGVEQRVAFTVGN